MTNLISKPIPVESSVAKMARDILSQLARRVETVDRLEDAITATIEELDHALSDSQAS